MFCGCVTWFAGDGMCEDVVYSEQFENENFDGVVEFVYVADEVV